MTNEEIKKKIVEILDNNIRWQPYYYISRGIVYEDDLKNIADALIDANIFVDIDTLKDEQQSMNGILINMSSYMNYKLHELEHRAEIAEQKYKLLFQKYDSFFNDVTYCHKNFSDVDSEITKQAERELTEEGKMTEQEIELCLERFATCKTTDVMNFDYTGTLAYIKRLKSENAALKEKLAEEDNGN